MISKEQYLEILEQCTKYVQKYNEMFPGKMTEEFARGFEQAITIIETIVNKK